MRKFQPEIPDELKPVVNSRRRCQTAPSLSRPKSTEKQRKKTSDSPFRRFWKGLGRTFLWIITCISAFGLICASYGGNIPPSSLKGICLMVLAFPAWLSALVCATVLNAIWCRKALVVCAIAFVSCASAIWDFCPLNIINPSPRHYEKTPRFTLLTYNVTNFQDLTDTYDGDVNPTVAYILHTNADIVNLQESAPVAADNKIHFTQAQVDSLHSAYPYIITSGRTLTLLSKYPAEALHIPSDPKSKVTDRGDSDKIAGFRINIQGTPVTLFNVHLESYGLTKADKNLYQRITDLDDPDRRLRAMLRDVRTELFAKVQIAAVLRQREADRLVKLIEHFGGPNVIVAGDFNDAPGCYALRRLADCRLRQVYPELAFGPAITFHADRFYFRIDHILWRGNLKPLRLWKGKVQYSDHYPLTTAFAITAKAP